MPFPPNQSRNPAMEALEEAANSEMPEPEQEVFECPKCHHRGMIEEFKQVDRPMPPKEAPESDY